MSLYICLLVSLTFLTNGLSNDLVGSLFLYFCKGLIVICFKPLLGLLNELANNNLVFNSVVLLRNDILPVLITFCLASLIPIICKFFLTSLLIVIGKPTTKDNIDIGKNNLFNPFINKPTFETGTPCKASKGACISFFKFKANNWALILPIILLFLIVIALFQYL